MYLIYTCRETCASWEVPVSVKLNLFRNLLKLFKFLCKMKISWFLYFMNDFCLRYWLITDHIRKKILLIAVPYCVKVFYSLLYSILWLIDIAKSNQTWIWERLAKYTIIRGYMGGGGFPKLLLLMTSGWRDVKKCRERLT